MFTLFLRLVWPRSVYVPTELQISRRKMVKIRDVARVWNDLKPNALYRRWSGSTSGGSRVTVLKKYRFFPTNAIDSFFQPP
jgi:hypothetical protein